MLPIVQRRLEATVAFVVCLYLYHSLAYSMPVFMACFFLPDISILFYLKNARIGGIAYNCAHFLLLPLSIGLYAYLQGDAGLLQIALIWTAHIAFDRMLGWGLKFDDSFCNTDMGRKSLPIDIPILR